MSWDLVGKALVKECTQDFVSYFTPGARYVGMRDGQVQSRLDSAFDEREMRADAVPEVEYHGLRSLVNVEWQSTKDDKMDERLLGYSYELTRLHDLSVRSVVIYTQAVARVPQSPLARIVACRALPEGNVALWFQFASLELCEKEAAELLALNLDAFAVLALLCKDGGTIAVLEEVLERLFRRRDQRRESIVAALFFAGKVFKTEEDKRFLERKRAMIHDSLTESWMYQKILGEGWEKGIAEGREKGIAEGKVEGKAEGKAEGKVEAFAQSIEFFIAQRFPAMLSWSQDQVKQISDPARLQRVAFALYAANTEEEIKAAFSA